MVKQACLSLFFATGAIMTIQAPEAYVIENCAPGTTAVDTYNVPDNAFREWLCRNVSPSFCS